MICNPKNEFYIGQTISLKRRLNSYKNLNGVENQKMIYNSLKKYGFENHKVEILCSCNKNDLDLWEKFYIKLFDSFNNGLNLTSGGKTPIKKRGYKLSEEWKFKISNSHKGKKREPFSEEWKKNIGIAHKQIEKSEDWLNNLKIAAEIRKNNGGYVIKQQQKEKSSNSMKEFYNTNSGKILKENLSKRCTIFFSKTVLQISNGEVINEYPSARGASRITNIAHSHIINCCNNKVSSAGGYIWAKKENNG